MYKTPQKSMGLPTTLPTFIKFASRLTSTMPTKIFSSASSRKAMHEAHRDSQQCQKRQEKQKQKEISQPHPEECEKPARKQECQPVNASDTLCDVSHDEMDRPNTKYPKVRVEPKRFGVYMDEGLDLGLTSWESKPTAIRSTDKLVGANTPGQSIYPVMKLSGKEKTISETTLTPVLSPQDVPDCMHSLRQHPTKNAEGDILLYGAPTGSGVARNIVPLVHKAKHPGYTPLGREQIRFKYYSAKYRPATDKVDGPIQRLNLIEGDILVYQSEPPTGNNKDDRKYVLRLLKYPDVIGWVFEKDVEPVYNPELLLAQREGGHKL